MAPQGVGSSAQLKILFVINDLYTRGNGLAASARRTIMLLREWGHDVRVLSAPPRHGDDCGVGVPDYPLPHLRIPLVAPLIASQCYAFARSDRRQVDRALAWADLVHLEEPFVLQAVVARRARARGVPALATYHIHPENLTASVYLDRCAVLNRFILEVWKRFIFNRCGALQCPSGSVWHRLAPLGLAVPLFVLSNGVPLDGVIDEGGDERGGRPVVRLLSVGRFSREKDQATILRALRYSSHARSIELTLAGRGLTERRLRKLSGRLVRDGVIEHPVRFAFMGPAEMAQASRGADLYVHAARIEVEGLGALEALRHGVVPVLARGPLTATSQFALSAESVFEAGDPRSLACAIDDWIDRGSGERRIEGARYRRVGAQYDIRSCVGELERVYRWLVAGGEFPGRGPDTADTNPSVAR
jgi:hypothetical protein